MKKICEKNINTSERYDESYGVPERLKIDRADEEVQAKRKEMTRGLENGMKIVELGCGNSDLLISAKKEFPECEVHGLDFSPIIINYLKKNTEGVEYIVGNALKTPYNDHYFDYVVAGELLEHTENPKDLVSEMARICKEDGIMAVSVPFLETTWRDPYAEHIWEFDRQDMIDIFSPYGHTEIKLFMGKGRHMIAVCQRKKTGVLNPYRQFKELRAEKKIVAMGLKGKEFESVLELGCQWGECLEAIKEIFPKKILKGIDINRNVIEEAKKFTKGIELEFGDVNRLNIPDKSFDVVFTDALLCMITPKEIEHTLKEMIRIAKKYIILVELDNNDIDRFGYIGISGRTVGNYSKILGEYRLRYLKRKITKDEWDAEPWLSYGYLIEIQL